MATARKIPSGKYRVRVFSHKEASGKLIYRSFTASTKREAEYMAAEFAAKRKNIEGGDMTVGEAYDRYIESKSAVLSPATVREYLRSSKADLQDLMPIKLKSLTQEKIQRAINREAAGHSPKTVQNIHGLLSAVLDMFYPDFRLRTTLPQKQPTEIKIPENEDIKKLLETASGKPIELAIMLGAFGGLRRSEICALKKSDIKGDSIKVGRAMVLNKDKKWIIKQPKTIAGTRTVPLPDFIISKLIQFESKSEFLIGINPNSLYKNFQNAITSAGIEAIRFHDLRHYNASILHALGIPDKYIQERGGWKTNTTLKNIYQHTLSEEKNAFNKRANDFFDSYMT